MRALVDRARLREFLQALGRVADRPTRVYLTGGATALLLGWRESTLDVDLLFVPESDALYQALPALKEQLSLNVEIVSPAHFIPELPGWADRSPFVFREGQIDVYHYDLCAQALAKIERGHARDREDVAEMLRRGLVTADLLRARFEEIAPGLTRFPAIDAKAFRAALDAALTPP